MELEILQNTYNKNFFNALNKVEQKIPPIWFMRQAGRYHQHYRKLKEKYSFEQLCKEPELACEVTLGPIVEFDFDAAILNCFFSGFLFLCFLYNVAPPIPTPAAVPTATNPIGPAPIM